jgi:hypothetical protein
MRTDFLLSDDGNPPQGPYQVFAVNSQCESARPHSHHPLQHPLIDLSTCYRSTYVTIEVGPEKKVYVMHKDLLVFYSDYFRAAFNGTFKEATEGKISLPDEREDVFDIFNHFIYSRRIADQTDDELSWDQLIGVWLFGDKYIVPSLQNVVMDAFIARTEARKATPVSHISSI